jgi:hypothetical protein
MNLNTNNIPSYIVFYIKNIGFYFKIQYTIQKIEARWRFFILIEYYMMRAFLRCHRLHGQKNKMSYISF